MQQLSFLETSSSQHDNDMWSTLDDEQRTLVLDKLARLLTRVIAARTSVNDATDVEASHD